MLGLLFTHEGHVVPAVTISVVIAGMLVLAGVDVWRREVEDVAIVVLLGVAAIGMHIEGISLEQWLGAALASAVAFMIYLGLGQRGVLGGGDVKLSIVPALVLGAMNPVMGLWWVACAIVIHQLFFFINARVQKEAAAIPHVPAMAAAALVAAIAFPASI
jgi:Flp pilus assembly protein protease CpaA